MKCTLYVASLWTGVFIVDLFWWWSSERSLRAYRDHPVTKILCLVVVSIWAKHPLGVAHSTTEEF